MFSLVCATVSTSLWPLSWLLSWLSLCTLGGGRCGLVSNDPKHLSARTLPQCADTPPPPQSTAYLCRLLTHNFSVFLFCSSVLHLHPCRYCSFVPSSPQIHLHLRIVYILYIPAWIARLTVMPNANLNHFLASRISSCFLKSCKLKPSRFVLGHDQGPANFKPFPCQTYSLTSILCCNCVSFVALCIFFLRCWVRPMSHRFSSSSLFSVPFFSKLKYPFSSIGVDEVVGCFVCLFFAYFHQFLYFLVMVSPATKLF